MGLLYLHRDVAAREVKTKLDVTDGNLASHVARLEAAGWVTTRKVLSRSGFELRLRITPEGSAAFRGHLAELRRLLDSWEP